MPARPKTLHGLPGKDFRILALYRYAFERCRLERHEYSYVTCRIYPIDEVTPEGKLYRCVTCGFTGFLRKNTARREYKRLLWQEVERLSKALREGEQLLRRRAGKTA